MTEPGDKIDGDVVVTLHWRDALIAAAELRDAADHWRASRPEVGARLDRVVLALEEQGRRGARAELAAAEAHREDLVVVSFPERRPA